MLLETLIAICDRSLLSDWDIEEYDLNSSNVEEDIVKQFKLIEVDGEANISQYSINSAMVYYIIKHLPTNNLYKVTVPHCSWSDSSIEDFQYNLKIYKVEEHQVTITTYEPTREISVEDFAYLI